MMSFFIIISLLGFFLIFNNSVSSEENHIPTVILQSPENNTILKTTSPELIWDGYDKDDDSLNYTISIYSIGGGIIFRYFETSNTSIILDLPDDMVYNWTVFVYDGKDENGSKSEEWIFTINQSYGDTNPPLFNNRWILNPVVGEDVEITVNVTDNFKVKFVKLYFRNFGEIEYKNIEMLNTFENNFTATILSSDITNKTIEYYFWAYDGINNSTSPINNPKENPFNQTIFRKNIPLSDLKISKGDIKFSNEFPIVGEEINIEVTVKNIGNFTAYLFDVIIYLDDELFGNESVFLLENDQKEVLNFKWTAVEGNHEFIVKIDEKNTISELNESNNNASISIIILDISNKPTSSGGFSIFSFLLRGIYVLPFINLGFLIVGIIVKKKTGKNSKKNKAGIVLIIIGMVIGFVIITYSMIIAKNTTQYEEWVNDPNTNPGDSIIVVGAIDTFNETDISGKSIFIYYLKGSNIPLFSSSNIGSDSDYVIVEVAKDDLGIPNVAGTYKFELCNILIIILGIIGLALAISGKGQAKSQKSKKDIAKGKNTSQKSEDLLEESKEPEELDDDELEPFKEEKKTNKRMKCPKCKEPIEITSEIRPLKVNCGNCSKGFILKPKEKKEITEIVVCAKCGKSVAVYDDALRVRCTCGNNIMVEP